MLNSRPEFDEASGREVIVEGERFQQGSASHDGKACRVDERVGTFVMAAEPAPRIVLDITCHLDDLDGVRALDELARSPGRCMTVATAQEGPHLTENVVRCEQAFVAIGPQHTRFGVMSVAA